MPDAGFSFDISTDQFEVEVLQRSHQVPILVDFWAAWCGPCRTLKPMLEQLAEAYNGAFLLAKVNTEEEQELAAHFGIRSLPTVKLFKNGSPVDEFMGALPEEAVRELLDRHLQATPGPAEALHDQARQALLNGDRDSAQQALQQALEHEPGNTRLRLELSALLLDLGDLEAAKATLQSIPADQRDDAEVKAMLARLSFASANTADLQALQARADANPDDDEAISALADALVQSGDPVAAMEQLLKRVSRDDGSAREKMLKIFDLLGDDPLVKTYRTRLFNTLH